MWFCWKTMGGAAFFAASCRWIGICWIWIIMRCCSVHISRFCLHIVTSVLIPAHEWCKWLVKNSFTHDVVHQKLTLLVSCICKFVTMIKGGLQERRLVVESTWLARLSTLRMKIIASHSQVKRSPRVLQRMLSGEIFWSNLKPLSKMLALLHFSSSFTPLGVHITRRKHQSPEWTIPRSPSI